MSIVSVIIPNFNREAFIGKTLENVLAQSRTPDEVIVVDDGSTDNSVEVIKTFGSAVRLIEQDNSGPGAARNRGLAASRGDYIWFMDSDDLASLNKIEVQLEALERSGADFAYSPWVRCRFAGSRLHFAGCVLQAGPVPESKSMLEWQLGSWCLVFQNCLLRRSAIERTGKYREDLMPTEDSEFLVRLLMAGNQGVHTPECLTFYRTDAAGQQQITGSGRNEKMRAEDRSHYLDLVMDQVWERWTAFKPSTRREALLDVWRHERYCVSRNFKGISESNPIAAHLRKTPALFFFANDITERCLRRLYRIPADMPSSRGLVAEKAGRRELLLARAAGFEVVKSSPNSICE